MGKLARYFGLCGLAASLIFVSQPATEADDPSLRDRVRHLFRRDRSESQAPVNRSQNEQTTQRSSDVVRPVAAGLVPVSSADPGDSATPATPAMTAGAIFPSHSTIESPAHDILPSTLDVATLEQLALAHNPTLVQVQAAIDAARGRQVQAGLYPNPSVGYVGSEIGNDGRAGQQGISISQEIVRGGKLSLSQMVTAYEIEQAEARAEAQRRRVRNAVRTAYFEAIVAQRTVAAIDIRLLPKTILAQFTDAERAEAEQKQLVTLAEKGVQIADDLLKGGQGTKPDLLQAEVEAEQVRILAENAANNYRAAWKRLITVIGVADLQPVRLTDDPEKGIAELASEEWLDRILTTSPEVRAAEAGVRRSEAAVRRAQAEPIPNVTLEAGTQYDYASRDTIASVGLSIPLPIRNRNQGNILAAEAERVRATSDVNRVKLALANRFATAFARYENARQQVDKYHNRILPKAEETLNLVREGYQKGQFPFLQVLTAQRTLAQISISYLQALGDLRASMVDIEGLLLNGGLSTDATTPVDV